MTGNLLKKSSGFILLCSISLLMLVMTGCQEAKLKTVIADRKSTRLNSSHMPKSRMPSSA